MRKENKGVKIKIVEASTLYDNKEEFEWKYSVFDESLLLQYLLENGLEVQNNTTKDIICLNFKNVTKSKNATKSKNREKLREHFYINGADVTYVKKDKTKEKVHYQMLFRSSGKAKSGSCIFIREELYDVANNFMTMGIELPDENAPLVEMSAYKALIGSSIIDTIQIKPENILVLRDVNIECEKDIIEVKVKNKVNKEDEEDKVNKEDEEDKVNKEDEEDEVNKEDEEDEVNKEDEEDEEDKDKECYVVDKDDKNKSKMVINTLFDGQALIDSSIFPEWADGYILLRNHFCKMASFNTNIQLFFKDYFGETYETAEVYDMFGNPHFAKDIQLITTDNAMKWLKFDGVTYKDWCERINENDNKFGIVKTAHESRLNGVQRMSYQMVNALDMDIIEDVVKVSEEYVRELKGNNDKFLEYLEANKTFMNDYEVLIALVNQDKDFLKCDYFRDRKRYILSEVVKQIKKGRLLQDADNLTIVGSPYAMLLHAVGEAVEEDDTFNVEQDSIQCYTSRFAKGEYLAEFRNPFNSKNNMGYLHNVYNNKLNKYFNLGDLCIAVNMIKTDFQDRNNGSDQDSDSIYVTNQAQIVACAKECYKKYPTIVNRIGAEITTYSNILKSYADMDTSLASAQVAIGEASNLAQLALTYTYNFKNEKYDDYVCILSVLAQVAIDNAKRKYNVDLNGEIRRIRKEMDIVENGYPLFWKSLGKKKDDDKETKFYNSNLSSPLETLFCLDLNTDAEERCTDILQISKFYHKYYDVKSDKRPYKKVEGIIKKFTTELANDKKRKFEEDYKLREYEFDKLLDEIKVAYKKGDQAKLFSWLIDRAFIISDGAKRTKGISRSTLKKNKPMLINILYRLNPSVLLECLSKNVNVK